MGRESASYFLPLPAGGGERVAAALAGAAELVAGTRPWVELRLRDEHRYWIDLRLHEDRCRGLELRIALTNDEWSIRAPIEAALASLPADVARGRIHDEDGGDLGVLGEPGWSVRLEQDFGRRRAQFVARVGDFTAPISADHVYLYVHQTRWNRDNDRELEWHREREISRIERMWEGEPQLPPEHPDHPGEAGDGS